MKLLYDGLLTEETARHVRAAAREYGYAIELRDLPDTWHTWSGSNLVEYPDCAEDCMGRPYTRLTLKYTIVRKCSGDRSLFLFLKSAAEKAAALAAFADCVVSAEPFRTLVD